MGVCHSPVSDDNLIFGIQYIDLSNFTLNIQYSIFDIIDIGCNEGESQPSI